jgi:hypothetical protein
MNVEADRLRDVPAAQAASMRQQMLQMLAERSDRKVTEARNVADLLEYGHDTEKRRSPAAAMLLDVLA